MNARELTNELNKVIAVALQEGIKKGKLEPSQLIGALELQKVQLVMQFMAVAAAQQAQQQAQNIITLGNNIVPPR